MLLHGLPSLDPPPVMRRVLPVELRLRERSASAQCLWMDGHTICLVTNLPLELRQNVVGNIALDAGRPVRSLIAIVAKGNQAMRRGSVYAGRWRVHDPQDRARLLDVLRSLNQGADIPAASPSEALPRMPHRFMHSPARDGGSLYISVSSTDELRKLVRLEGGEVHLRLPKVPQLVPGHRPTLALQLHDGVVIDLVPEVIACTERELKLVDRFPTPSVLAILLRVFEPDRDPPSLISII